MNRYFQLPAAIALFAAAILKTDEFVATGETSFILGSAALTIALIIAELTLAFWLVSGWRESASQAFAQGLFLLFLIATASKLIAGEVSCGCFGRVVVPPWVTAIVDLILLVLISQWQTREAEKTAVGRRMTIAACGWLLCALLVSGYAYQFAPQRLELAGDVLPDNRTIVLDHQRWIGQNWPLFDHVDNSFPMKQGKWFVVLYHDDCQRCQSLMESLRSAPQDVHKLSFVEVPPFKSSSQQDSPRLIWRALNEKYKWFAQTPVVIELEDGVVVNANSGDTQLASSQ